MKNKNYLKLLTGTTRWLCSLLIITGLWITNSFGQTTVVIPSSGNFTVPSGATSMSVYVYGAGGGSGGCVSGSLDQAGGGGGGGACAIRTVAVTAGQVYAIVVGGGGTAGAAGGAGGTGNPSSISGPAISPAMSANGGTGGGGAATNGSAGTAGLGATTGANFTTIFAGGNGTTGFRNTSNETGGAGGGGAGNNGAGGNGSGAVGIASTGGVGGNGTPTNAAPYKGAAGIGMPNSAGTYNGTAGVAPGGGAGGAASYTATATGAIGGAGQVVIIHNAPAPPTVLVPFSGSNSVTCGTTSNLYDHAGASADYSSGANGYTVLNNSGTGVITLTGTAGPMETCCDFVRVYTGILGSAGTLVATYTFASTTAITPYTSAAGQPLSVVFFSDGSITGGTTAGGFAITATYTGACAVACTQPTSQASTPTYTNNTTGTTLTTNWTRGNGTAGLIVVARLTATSAVDPTPGTSYAANANFGSGATTGAGNFVVYNSTGTSVNVTGLTQGTSYTFTAYEYNTTGTCYKTPGAGSAVTTFSYPTVLVPFSGSNSVTCGTTSNLYDHAGPSADYSSGANGYTVLNNQGTGVITLTGTAGPMETCCDFVRVYTGTSGSLGTLVATYTFASTTAITPYTSAAGQPLSVVFVSDGSITGGTTAGGFAITATYTGSCVIPPPTISSFSPSSGCGYLQQVTINGSGFTGATAVKFGGTNASSYTVVSDILINAYPANATSGLISVTTASGTGSSGSSFTVNADVTAPAISGCPSTQTLSNTAGVCGRVVTFSSPTATDACSGAKSASQTFTYTGASQSFVVPGGVTSITVDVQGAQGIGGSLGYGNGGLGGRLQATYTVTPGSTLQINVGGQGSGATGGFNGGGAAGGSSSAGGGGGASDIRVSPYALADRFAVAGGGGGGSGDCSGVNVNPGGVGGGLTGADGWDCSTQSTIYTGKAGTQAGGGAGGTGSTNGTAGTSGVGGTGGLTYGGGGGGGYFGGGGGGYGGAGGGSAYLGSGSIIAHTSGFKTGNGLVTISYSVTYPAISQTSGLPSGSTFPTGTTNNVFTASDAAGNTSTCGFSITINDTEVPSFTSCPTNQVLSGTTCTQVATWTAPAASDNCAAAVNTTLSYTGAMQTYTVPAGVTSLTIEAVGATGGSQTGFTPLGGNGAKMVGTFTVTPGQVLKVLVGGAGGSTSNLSAGGGGGGGTFVTDNSNNPLIIAGGGGGISVNANGYSPVGINAVTTTSGVNGYSTAAGFPSNYGVGGTGGGGATNNGASGACAGNAGGLSTSGAANVPSCCSTTQGSSYLAGGAGGPFCVSGGGAGGFGGGGGSGNNGAGGGGGYSGGGGSYHFPTNGGGGGSFNGGTSQANTAAFNASGNGSVIFSSPGSATITQIAGLASGSAFPVGVTTNTFRATDPSGNTSTCSFNITYTETTPPAISWTGGSQTIALNSSCQATMPSYTASGSITKSDNCGTPTVTQVPAAGATLTGTGNTTVKLTATDGSGNTATTNFILTRTDGIAPTISWSGGTQTINLDGSCNITVPDYTASGSITKADNCTSPTVTQSPAAGTVINGVGSTTVTLTATDPSTNTATTSFSITRADVSAPSISWTGGTQTVNLDGSCNITVPNYTASGFITKADNCTSPSVTQSPAAGTVINGVGSTTVTLTATDPSTNTATTSFSITRADATAPAITTCPAGFTTCSATPSLGTPAGTDNCGTVSFSNDAPGSFPVGTTTVVWTADDGNGNTATCQQSVTRSASPTASAGGSQAICETGTATVSGASSSNGTILWTHNGNGSLTNANTNAPTYTPGTGDAGNTVTLTMTVSNAPCPDATANYSVAVSAGPTASAGGSQAICETGTATVSGASSSNGTILWTHNGNGSLTNANTNAPTYTPGTGDAGTTVTLTMTVSNAPCPDATANYSVAVSAGPTASAGGSQAICESSTATVSGASSSNGTILWTHNGNGSLTNANTNAPTYTPGTGDAGNTVTLTMTVSNAPCPNATATYSVAVSAAPTALAGGSQAICESSTATVSGASSSNGTILWTHNGNGSLTNANTNAPTYTPGTGDAGNTVTLTMTVSNAPCPDATATYSVAVSAGPTASAGGSANVCGATSGTVSGASSSNGTILWTHNGGGTLTNATTNAPTYNAVAGDVGNTVTLTMTVSNAPCPNATATYTMNVRQLPTATVSGNNSICLGQSSFVNITFPAGNASWTYTLDDGTDTYTNTSATNSTTQQVTPPSGGTHNYQITALSDAYCTNNTGSTGQATILVNTSPPANSITSVSSGVLSACAGDVVLLTANGAGGPGLLYNFNQASNSGTVLFGPTASGPWTASYQTSSNQAYAQFGALPLANSGYYACVFGSNGCLPNTNNKCSFIRGRTSAPSAISGMTTVCNNSSPVGYTVATVAGATVYTWTFSGGASFSNNGTSSPSTNVTYTQTNPAGQLCVTAAVSCIGAGPVVQSAQKCVTIGNSIATPAVITGPATVCPGSPTQYTYSVPQDPNASSYTWLPLPAGVNPVGATNTNTLVVTVSSLAGSPSVCIKAISSCGTQSTARCKTIASGLPATPGNIAGPQRGVCSGDQLNYSVPNVLGVTYDWTIPAQGINFTGDGPNMMSFNIVPPFTSGSVSVTANNGCGASPVRSITIFGVPDPPASITPTPNPVCANQPANFLAATPVGAGSVYAWSVTGGTITSTPPYTNSINVAWGPGNGSVSASAKNVCGTGGAKVLNVVTGCREESGFISSSTNFSVYPNPAHDQLTLSIDAKESAMYNVQVLDLAGRVMQSETAAAEAGMNQYQMDLTHLAKGVYMLSVQSAGDSWKTRVVVE